MKPPIPQSFPRHDWQGETLVVWRMRGGELDSAHKEDRIIIAAIGFKAWMMEANKLMKKCMDEGRFHDRYGIEDEPENEQYEKYCDNAGQWLIWEKEV